MLDVFMGAAWLILLLLAFLREEKKKKSCLFFTAVKKTFLERSNAFPESAACHFAFSASQVGARVPRAMMVLDTDVFCLDDENSLYVIFLTSVNSLMKRTEALLCPELG